MRKPGERAWTLLPWVFLACASGFLLLVNIGDWDYLLTTLEVDRRAWLLNHELPLWSYQLCGGATRIGDPQSYGLSPLFSVVLAFGSLWGAKLLVLGLWALGFFYLRALLAEIGTRKEIATGLSLLFFSSNFFLWHLGMGHANFALIGIALMLAFYLERSCRQGLKGYEKALVALGSWAFLTAAFYHVLIFFVLPMLIPGILVGAPALYLSSKERRARILRGIREWGLEASLGLVLASYKWVAILQYQHAHPRSLAEKPAEIPGLLQLATDLVFPTINGKALGFIPSGAPYGIHEWNVFSLIPWLLLAAAIPGLTRLKSAFPKGARGSKLGLAGSWALAGLAIAFAYCLGDAAPWLPHPWLNSLLFSDAVRAVGRYQLVAVFCLLLLLARLAAVSPRSSGWLMRWGLPISLALALLNLATFAPMMRVGGLSALISIPRDGARGLGSPVIVTPAFSFVNGSLSNSSMYPAALQGKIILNCYQAMTRQALVANERGPLVPMERGSEVGEYRLVENEHLAPAELERCREAISLTQNHLGFPPGDCPPGTCLNLNGLNPADDRGFLVLDPGRRRYCFEGIR